MLLRKVSPDKKENLPGLLLRITEANYYKSPLWVHKITRKWWGLHFLSFSENNRFIPNIASETGLDETKLSKLMYYPVTVAGKSHYELFGQPIPKWLLRPHEPKLCPMCLEENPIYDKCWDVFLVNACPFHRNALIRRCPRCNTRIDWYRPSVTKCKCGFDFRESKSPEASLEETALASLIYRQCDRIQTIPEDINALAIATPLYGLSLRHLLLSVIIIAGVLENQIDTSGKLLGKRYRDNVGELIKNTMQVFFDWPKSYYRFLAELTDNPAGCLHNNLKGYYQVLYQGEKDPGFNFLRESLEDYAAQFWTNSLIVSRYHIYSERYSQKAKYLLMSEAEKLLGIARPALDRLINKGYIKSYKNRKKKAVSHLVEKESVLQYKKIIGECISKHEAASVLGVAQKTVVKLVHKGLLAAVPGSYNEYLFTKQEISRFLTAIIDKCILISSPENASDVISFENTINYMKQKHLSTVGLIVKVLEGTIIPRAFVAQPKINQLVFRQKDLDIIKFQNFLSVKDVAVMFKCDTRRIPDIWVRMGLLIPEGQGITRFRREQVEQALEKKADLVTLPEAVKLLNVKVHEINAMMDRGTLVPVAGPRTGTAAHHVFSLKDILAIKHR